MQNSHEIFYADKACNNQSFLKRDDILFITFNTK